jgi:ribonucleases P/MRP protein subunit RPP40
MALSKFTDDVNNALNDQKLVMTIFIDFKKAYDTLDHDSLLQSMKECGIRGPANLWFRNYLKNRTLEVNVSGTSSDVGTIKYGVPTGSVFGPVGYIVHVNSMHNVIKSSRTYMYADDTCLMYCDRDPLNIQKAMQEDLDNIVMWAHDNGIIININKTKCMLISSPYSHQKQASIAITGHTYDCLHSNGRVSCRCEQLEHVQSYKYLGLIIDNKFSWKLHVEQICKKLRTVLGKMYHLKYQTNRGILHMIYHALADSTIGYGLGSYGLTFPVHINKIKNIQVRLIKILASNKDKNACNKEYEKLFKICKIIPIDKKVKMTILLEEFDRSEHKKEREYNYPTRQSKIKKYVVPRSKNYFGERSRRWIVPTTLNELPKDLLGEVISKNHLKNVLKKYYLSMSVINLLL